MIMKDEGSNSCNHSSNSTIYTDMCNGTDSSNTIIVVMVTIVIAVTTVIIVDSNRKK